MSSEKGNDRESRSENLEIKPIWKEIAQKINSFTFLFRKVGIGIMEISYRKLDSN